MPFIRGRYHINPIAGEALEAAREAEAALLALQQVARAHEIANGDAGDTNVDRDGSDDTGASARLGSAKGPVHHIEIEAAELVPAHSGCASRGFVARVHRAVVTAPASGRSGGANAGAYDHSDDQADGFAESDASADRQSPLTWSAPNGTAFDLVDLANFGSRAGSSNASRASQAGSAAPETHVFADHRDLLNFLGDILARDCSR